MAVSPDPDSGVTWMRIRIRNANGGCIARFICVVQIELFILRTDTVPYVCSVKTFQLLVRVNRYRSGRAYVLAQGEMLIVKEQEEEKLLFL